jgi:hypothetical protein
MSERDACGIGRLDEPTLVLRPTGSSTITTSYRANPTSEFPPLAVGATHPRADDAAPDVPGDGDGDGDEDGVLE